MILSESSAWLPEGFEFLSGLPTPERKRRVLVLMQAWFDESGDKGQGGYLTMAGFIAPAEIWADFSDHWTEALHKPPRLEAFHMDDAANHKNEFSRWSDAVRDEKVRVLADAINTFQPTFVHCSIDLQAFDELFPKVDEGSSGLQARRLRTFSHPYFYCFTTACTMVCLELRDRGERERFQIIFDEKETMAGKVLDWYPTYRAHLTQDEQAIMPNLPLFLNDVDQKPLQAADLMAWPLRREYSRMPNPFPWLGEAMQTVKVSKYAKNCDRAYFLDLKQRADRMLKHPDQEFVSVLREFLDLDE